MGRDDGLEVRIAVCSTFQSTLPTWGETRLVFVPGHTLHISIHSPHMGRDLTWLDIWPGTAYFNPLSPHGERHALCYGHDPGGHISIHSPHMGRDQAAGRQPRPGVYFNPLSPHGERRPEAQHGHCGRYFNPLSPHGERLTSAMDSVARALFQSTLPTWGETCNRRIVPPIRGGFQSTLPTWGETSTVMLSAIAHRDFNPLSPHGERHGIVFAVYYGDGISIHSPHMGRDTRRAAGGAGGCYFNPLSPHGERLLMVTCGLRRGISIHSPHMGRDWACGAFCRLAAISIHSPHMGRDALFDYPFRGAWISIHSPHMGRDYAGGAWALDQKFQSTLPTWGETGAAPDLIAAVLISIHSPHMGRDMASLFNFKFLVIFQSTLPTWGETIDG